MSSLIFKRDIGDIIHDGKRLGRLNSSETDILLYLYLNKGNLIGKDKLLEIGWPKKFVSPNSLNVAIKNIRACFEKINVDDVIVTHVKKGFSWNEQYDIDVVDSDAPPSKSSASMSTILTEENNSGNTHIESLPEDIIVSQVTVEPETTNRFEIKSYFISIYRSNFWLVITLKCLYIFFIALLITIILIYIKYWTPMECYNVHGAKLCGVGHIDSRDIPNNIKPGNYIYGYLVQDGKLFYEDI